jgi:RNA polymerase sigma factor FliA
MEGAVRQRRVSHPENERQSLCNTNVVATTKRRTVEKSEVLRRPPMREQLVGMHSTGMPSTLERLAPFARAEKTTILTEKEKMPAPVSFRKFDQEDRHSFIQPNFNEAELEEDLYDPLDEETEEEVVLVSLRSSKTDLESAVASSDNSTQLATEAESRFALRDRVVLEHLPLVRAIAVRVHENLPVHVDLDDLVHAGIMGLFDAATKYDPEKNVAFSSYAKHRIKGAILDSLRQLDWASRDLRRRHKQVEAATRDLATELQRNPTEDEVASKLGVEVDRWRQMMVDLRNVGLVSASTRSNESEDLPAPEFPTSPDTHPDSICAKEELRSMLATALRTLPERYQKVVMYYYANELTMKEIGGMLGINESRVSQIHKAALEKMANALAQAGISSAAAF